MSMTPEQEAMVAAWVEHYNENAKGKTLKEFVSDELMLAMIVGMLKSIVHREGQEELWPVIAPLLAEAVSVGIWVAEVGKTSLLTEGRLQ